MWSVPLYKKNLLKEKYTQNEHAWVKNNFHKVSFTKRIARCNGC